VVEVDAGDGIVGGVVRCGSAEYAGVLADIGSDPVARDVVGI